MLKSCEMCRCVAAVAVITAVSFTALGAQQNPNIIAAGDLLVELDAGHVSAGDLEWENTADDAFSEVFIRVGNPIVEDVQGMPAVSFNLADTDDAYRSGFLDADVYVPEFAPPGLTGLDATRSIEVWAFNADIRDEETLVAWGKRGGPEGSNMAFNYGKHGNFGAVGHWGGGGPDLGWVDNTFTPGAPVAGLWHHLVYTYDGTTTRVYSDGCKVDEFACPQNEEELGEGVINTHELFPVVLAAQTRNDVLDLEFVPGPGLGNEGALSIGRVRVHDGVLSAEDIQNNYDEECLEFCPQPIDPECLNCPEADVQTRGKSIYARNIATFAFPLITDLRVVSPAGATISLAGKLFYENVDGIDSDFTVEIEAENENTVVTFSWDVTLIDAIESNPKLEVAGELFVDLDATDSKTAGEGIWQNAGTMNDFVEVGDPVRVEIAGVQAVDFNSGVTNDAYQTPEAAPAGLVGIDPTRSIEVWAFNPDIIAEETLVAWGRRGGPDGTNMSFNYGTHGLFGAVGHWGGDGPDIGWDDAGGAPEFGAWHHLVYTFDGGATNTTRVYNNGILENSETLGPGVLNTHDGFPVTLAVQIADAAGGHFFAGNEGVLALARVRVHDDVLSIDQIRANFNLERDEFGVGPIENEPPLIVGTPLDDVSAEGLLYSAVLRISGFPTPDLNVITPDGGEITGDGLFTYRVPNPAPDSFDVEIEASNKVGDISAFWTVSVIRSEPLETGPVHRYSFTDSADDSIGEAHGVVIGDVSFDGSQASLNNDGSQRSNDPDPGAYVDLPNNMISALAPNATFETWVTWNGPGGSAWQRIFDFGTSAGGEDISDGAVNNHYVFMTPRSGPGRYHAGYRTVQGLGAGVPREIEDTSAIGVGAEHHLVMTWDGDAFINSLYLDGLLVDQDFAVHMGLDEIPDVNNWLGRSQWNDPMLSGSYNEFRIYDYALLPEQVLGNFLSGPDCVNLDGEPCDLVGGGPEFIRGDADASGAINITDGIFVLNFLFLGGEDPSCKDAADADDSGAINITDGIYILNFLFLGGADPKAPWPDCGEDPEGEDDGVSCETEHETCI